MNKFTENELKDHFNAVCVSFVEWVVTYATFIFSLRGKAVNFKLACSIENLETPSFKFLVHMLSYLSQENAVTASCFSSYGNYGNKSGFFEFSHDFRFTTFSLPP